MRRSIRIALHSTLLALFLTGCFSSDPESPEETPPKELVQKSKEGGFDASTSEEDLFLRGKALYGAGSLAVAKDAFELLLSNYPVGPYAEFAELKLADIEFDRSEFAAAAGRYESFVAAHPASVSADYALYRQAESYRKANRGVGRDPSPLEKSLSTIRQLASLYPSSVYIAPAQKLQMEVVELLAEHGRFISSYYERRGMEKASTARSKEVAVRWEPLIAKPVEPAVPPANDPHSPTSIVSEPYFVALGRKDGELKKPEPLPTEPPEPNVKNPHYVVERMICEKDTVTIHLNRMIEAENQPPSSIVPDAEQIRVKLPNAEPSDSLRSRKTVPCFAADDLSITPDGEVVLKSTRQARAISLNYPPRLLLILQD